jgi:hypothetical protein
MSETRRPWWSLRRPAGIFLWTAAFLFFAGFLVPLIHANRFRRQIQIALEQGLGRRVEIGDITLRLLPAPGFQLENVVIGEDPDFGSEHFAYMNSMQARVRLRALWTGQVQLASLTLEEPSLNLVKNAEGRWNFEALMERAGSGAQGYFPYIGIEDGRINFKFGEAKSLLYFQEVEAAVSPPRDAGGRWWTRFAGRPARSDQVLSGMGRLRGEGSVTPTPRPALNFELALEESPMSYLLRLVQGRDHGVHGTLAARIRARGEPARVEIEGLVLAGDVHRWDIMPGQSARVELPVRGQWDVPGQTLRLRTAGSLPVRAEFWLSSYLSRPEWKAALDLDGLPAAPVVSIAEHFGASLPRDRELQGTLRGRLELAGDWRPQGQVRLERGRVGPAQIPAALLTLQGEEFTLQPTPIQLGQESFQLAAAGRLSPFRLEASVQARNTRIAALPVALPVSTGLWDGRLLYRKEPGSPGAWSGAGVVRQTNWQPRGLESPVEIAEARLRWNDQGVQVEAMRGAVGATSFTGSCRTSAGESACRLRVQELDLGQLDRWLNPRQRTSRWAVWKRALGLDSAQPGAWLRSARVQGSLQVDRLTGGPWAFRNLRSELAWKEGTLLLSALRGELGKGRLRGAMKVEFSGDVPRYSIQAAAAGVDLRSLSASGVLPENFQRGLVDVKLGLTAAGRTAAELRAGLRVQGVFEGRGLALEDVEIEPEGDALGVVEIRALEGQFAWSRDGLRLSKLRMALGRELYEGEGSIGGRPAVTLRMESGPRRWSLLAASAAEPVAEP